VLAALGAFLIVTGAPKTCSDREIAPVSAAVAAQLDERWDQFSMDIAAAATSIDITESEATSRARLYIEDRDLPLENLSVYFCGDGKGQLTGKVEALGIDADFVVTGHLDLSSARPVVALDSIEIGNLPGFVSDAAFDLLLDEDERTLELDENLLGSKISDGLIIISGGP
jgi:hypothetical protein